MDRVHRCDRLRHLCPLDFVNGPISFRVDVRRADYWDWLNSVMPSDRVAFRLDDAEEGYSPILV